MSTIKGLTRDNLQAQLDIIWYVLEEWRLDYPQGLLETDMIWKDVCTAMAWIEEDLEAAYNSAAFPEGGYDA
jgi:hypothetical protein